MNVSRFCLSALALWVFFFIFEWVFHGMLLMDQYEATASVWRSIEEMESLFAYSIAFSIAFSLLITFIFVQGYEAKGIGEGVRFGLYIGLFMALLTSSMYIYLPIPWSLACAWFFGGVLEGLGGGVVLASTYRN